MGEFYMISDAAKEVCVENHVLRYWEEELQLPIHRNESGHRIYTAEDVERFKQIKYMKEKGLQLRAIYTLIKSGSLELDEAQERVREPGGRAGENVQERRVEHMAENVQEKRTERMERIAESGQERRIERAAESGQDRRIERTAENGQDRRMEHAAESGQDISPQEPRIRVVESMHSMRPAEVAEQTIGVVEGTEEDKLERIQWLLGQLIRKSLNEAMPEVMRSTLESLRTDIREDVVKELDYQFRMQTEREEARDKEFLERNEFYYEQIDELIKRKKGKKKGRFLF